MRVEEQRHAREAQVAQPIVGALDGMNLRVGVEIVDSLHEFDRVKGSIQYRKNRRERSASRCTWISMISRLFNECTNVKCEKAFGVLRNDESSVSPATKPALLLYLV